MKKLRALVLMHIDLVPPKSLAGYSKREILEWKTEYDVLSTLRELGHEAEPLGCLDDLSVIRNAIQQMEPHIVFNLLEEFHGVAQYDQNVVGYLELLRQPYTGCNPRGLLISHDKALCKKILSYHRIPTPGFVVYPPGQKVRVRKRLNYPMLVKSTVEEASLGIAQASIVHSDEKLIERVQFIHERFNTEALAEEYIEGREFYVGVLGNQRLQTFPVWELLFNKMPEEIAKIATRRVKWDLAYQKKYGIVTEAAKNLSSSVVDRITRLCKRIYKVLNLSGYARMDLRMTEDGRIYVLEANPNPNLSNGEDFAESATKVGYTYDTLLQRILTLGLNYEAAWRV